MRTTTATNRPARSGSRTGKGSTLGGCLILILLVGGGVAAINSWARKKALDDLAAGDALYADGNKADAIAKYKAAYTFAPDDRKPEVLRRVVEGELEGGNADEARKWVERGVDDKLEVAYQAPAAKDLLARVQRDRAEAAARKEAEAARKKAEADERANGIAVTAAQLRQEYLRDAKAADARYKGRLVRVSGSLTEVIRDGVAEGVADTVVVVLNRDGLPVVQGHVPVGREGQLAGLRPGQPVTVKGRCQGLFPLIGEIRVADCTVER